MNGGARELAGRDWARGVAGRSSCACGGRAESDVGSDERGWVGSDARTLSAGVLRVTEGACYVLWMEVRC